ncbi:MAG: alpha amylase C-terminal domain-containing protein, partial [Candidatus Nanopelagicales bacterium]
TGAQITRYGKDNVFAASRIDAASRREYVVAFNNGDAAATVAVPTSTPSASWTSLLPGPGARTGQTGSMTLSVPPRGTVVLAATVELPPTAPPSIRLKAGQDNVTGKHVLAATVPGGDPATVTFVMRPKGGTAWAVIGSDDARPFRVFVTPAKGRAVDVAAIVRDSSGQVAATTPFRISLAPFL